MKEENSLEKIIKLLTDGYAIKILAATKHDMKSAIELSQELNVPIAACYRRLHALRSMGLVDVVEKITTRGKKIRYYKSKIKKADIKIENNHLVVEIFMDNGKTKRYRGKIIAG